jgi:hypothetical protein
VPDRDEYAVAQLHNALSNIAGATGQAIIRALLARERDPKTLAALSDRRCMASKREIVHSLEGVWKSDVLFELQQAVDPPSTDIRKTSRKPDKRQGNEPFFDLEAELERILDAWYQRYDHRRHQRDDGSDRAG